MCLGRVGYLSICGCGAEGPPCDSLPADGDCEEEASGVVLLVPRGGTSYGKATLCFVGETDLQEATVSGTT